MANKITIYRKVVWNKSNGQANLSLPKKMMPGLFPSKKKIKVVIRW